jgi:beta-glucosidase
MTLYREIYLKPFEIAIKEAKPWALMTSYNLVNGKHSDMNEYLLQKVLREQWGFQG